MQSRNAHFNLNRLGVRVETYADNFYGIDYNADPTQTIENRPGLQSDRLFASWYLDSTSVNALSKGQSSSPAASPSTSISIPADWSAVVKSDVQKARETQARVRSEFKTAFASGLVCAAFERGDHESKYLLFKRDDLEEL
jgi:predicted GNAT superfamily acetyltransferase